MFDQENLKIEAKNLYQFILKSSETLSFDLNKVTILGYSNGANILAYMMMHYQMPIKLAIMLHPMVPSNERPTVNNYDTYALMTAGTQDTMVPIKQTLSLKDMFDGWNTQKEEHNINTSLLEGYETENIFKNKNVLSYLIFFIIIIQ